MKCVICDQANKHRNVIGIKTEEVIKIYSVHEECEEDLRQRLADGEEKAHRVM